MSTTRVTLTAEEKLAAQRSRRASRFKTPKQLFASGVEEVKWHLPQFLPCKALVSIQSRAKAGKSTLIFWMLKAPLEGGEFLGNQLQKTKVVYLSEQPESVFKMQMAEAGKQMRTAVARTKPSRC